MLSIPNLEQIRDENPYTYEAMKKIVAAVNAVATSAGLDATGNFAAPPMIGSVSVSAANGMFDVAIVDKSPVRKAIHYFLEYDTQASFPNPRPLYLGPTRNISVFLGNQTLYFRAYSQYLGSPISPKITYGNPPTAVTGGGPAPAPPSRRRAAGEQEADQVSGKTPTLACWAGNRSNESAFLCSMTLRQNQGHGPSTHARDGERKSKREQSRTVIRQYTEADLEALRRMHQAQGFNYPFPTDLGDRIFLTKIVLEDGAGTPVMAALVRLTAEVYLLMDPGAGSPRERWDRLLALHAVAERDARARGLADAHAFLPPQVERAFGRRLRKLGWARDPWPAYCKKLDL